MQLKFGGLLFTAAAGRVGVWVGEKPERHKLDACVSVCVSVCGTVRY